MTVEDAWQPIETAPKDGSPILIYQVPACVRLNVYVVRWDADEEAWVEAAGEEYYRWAPTHWMPLPPPPKSVG